MTNRLSALDQLLSAADRALRTVAAPLPARRPNPAEGLPSPHLDDAHRRESAALMRVNHVGEVCAQALYEAQALASVSPELRAEFRNAAVEENDHLAWTRERIEALGGRPSLLNPLWYAGSFAIGLLAARFGDRASLGFMAETERQVELHLMRHLQRLPADDKASLAIVEQMRHDEAQHAAQAAAMGGAELPTVVRWAMRVASRVMTRVAHDI